jgi:hypothetical protein
MAEKILFAIMAGLAIATALFSAGVIREGARNVNELFRGVQVDAQG